MTKIFMRKEIGSLRPDNDAAEEVLSHIALGDVIAVDISRPRNVRFHRWWWKLMEIVSRNMPGDISSELVCEVLKIRVGHVTVVKTAKGEVFIPKSISFAKMDEDDFREFVTRAIHVITEDILPGVDSTALWNEVDMMLAGAK